MFLLILVPILVIIFNYAPKYTHPISKYIGSKFFPVTAAEHELSEKLTDLKLAQDQYTIVDDFAKYSKLQRQIDKLITQIQDKSSSRQVRTRMVPFGVKIGIQLINVICMLILILIYRHEPLMTLPSEWLFPLGRLIAFPTGQEGGVGLTFWILICNTVMYKTRRVIGL